MPRYRPHDISNLTETDDRQFVSEDQKGKLNSLRDIYYRDRAPVSTDDVTEGYVINDGWFDTDGKTFYRLVDTTEDNAVWEESTLTAEEAETIAQGEVTGHENTYDHDNLPTSTEKDNIGNLPADTNAELAEKLDAANIDGGSASATYTAEQTLDGEVA